MLTFVIIGILKGRTTILYNIVFASAFILLCIDPYMLMDVGFQLSYLAVLGIVLLNQRIDQWVDAPNWLLRQIWKIVAVRWLHN